MNAKRPAPLQENSSLFDSTRTDGETTIVELPNGSNNLDRQLELGMKNVKINQVLKTLMTQHRVNLKALSKATGIPLSTLGSYTAGKKASYNPEHLAKLCDHFKVSADYLLFGSESEIELINTLPTEEVFSGWLRVKVERAIPTKRKSSGT